MGVSTGKILPAGLPAGAHPNNCSSGIAGCGETKSWTCSQCQTVHSRSASRIPEEESRICGKLPDSQQPLAKGKVGIKPVGEVVICATSSYLAPKKNIGEPEFSIFGKLLDKKRANDVMKAIPYDDMVLEDIDGGGDQNIFPPSAARKVDHVTTKEYVKKEFEAELERGREKILGLIITPDFSPEFLYIEDIWDNSVVSDWNAQHSDSMKIKVGDIITAVNGASSRAEKMLEAIRALPTTATVTLKIEDIGNGSSESAVEPTWIG